MHIRESLLHSAEQGSLYISVQPIKLWWQTQVYLDAAAFGEAVHVPASGGAKTCFIQQRRMQQVRDGTCLRQTLVHNLRAFCSNGSAVV